MSTLTRIYLNPRKRGGRKLLTNPEAMHAAVRSAFPPDIDASSARVLWRADSQGDEHILYIVGPEKPDALHIVEQAGWDTRPPQSADYQRFQDALVKGQKWRFALEANPVSSKAGDRGTRGKIVAHVTAEQQLAWLAQPPVSVCLTTPSWSAVSARPSGRTTSRRHGRCPCRPRASRAPSRSSTRRPCGRP